jgi:hypothetical protein
MESYEFDGRLPRPVSARPRDIGTGPAGRTRGGSNPMTDGTSKDELRACSRRAAIMLRHGLAGGCSIRARFSEREVMPKMRSRPGGS